MFSEASGKPNVVCFKNMTEFIVNDKQFSREKKTQMTMLSESLQLLPWQLTNMLHYKAKNGDTLVSLWYAKFMPAIATCAVMWNLKLCFLQSVHCVFNVFPMCFHSLRVHRQICQQKYLNLHCLKFEE